MTTEKVKEIKGVQAVTLLQFLEKYVDKSLEEINDFEYAFKEKMQTIKLLIDEINRCGK